MITYDDDFEYLLIDKGFPPKVILLRTGNLPSKQIAEPLHKHHDQIDGFIKDEQVGLLEIF